MNDYLINDDELMKREPDPERLRWAYALLSTNVVDGVRELEALANDGSVMSMLYLAQSAQRRESIDAESAERWYRAAYERGSSTALFGLGIMYYRKGRYIEAEKYFVEGASKQDAPSMYWLATLYLTQSNDAAKHAKARMLLEEAIRCGSVHAKHGLGLLYMKGQFGIKYVLRGLWLFLAGIVDAFRVTYRDPLSRRLW